MQLYGMSAHREGNVIDLGFTQLQVVEACSGLRSLMSLIVLGLLMAYFESQNKLALMTVYKNYDRYDRSNTVVEGNLVRKFSNKAKTENMDYIEYGANIFRKEVLEMVPENQSYSLDDLFPRLIEMDELLAFEVKERFYEIGSPQGLRDFKEYVKGVK